MSTADKMEFFVTVKLRLTSDRVGAIRELSVWHFTALVLSLFSVISPMLHLPVVNTCNTNYEGSVKSKISKIKEAVWPVQRIYYSISG